MKQALLSLALVASNAAAWTAPNTMASSARSSARTQLMATQHQQQPIEEDESSSSSALDRRGFFQSAATKAASVSLLVASSTTAITSPLDIANAADTTTAYSKIYSPAPHSMDNKIVVITGEMTRELLTNHSMFMVLHSL